MADKLTVGSVIGGTIETFTSNLRPFGIYIGAMTVIGFGIEFSLPDLMLGGVSDLDSFGPLQDMLGLGVGLVGLAIVVVSILAQYYLWEALLRDRVLEKNMAKHRYFAFVGLSILSGLGTAFGFLLLIVPGLLCLGRWLMAPAFLIGENRGVFDALGESWNTTKGNTTPIILSFIIALIAFGFLGTLVGGMSVFGGDSSATSPIALLGSQLLSNLGSALGIAAGIFLFDHFRGSSAQIADVFG